MRPRALTVRLVAGTVAGLLLLAHLHHHLGDHASPPALAAHSHAVSAAVTQTLH